MNLTKRSKILIAVIGMIAVLGVVAQATGVLAAWNDKVWGSSTFRLAPATDGYARSITAHTKNQRLISGDTWDATTATHTFANPGTTVTPGATTFTSRYSGSGFFGVGMVAARGRSEATLTRTAGNISASATSTARDLRASPTPNWLNPFSSTVSVLDTKENIYTAAVNCTSSNYGETVTPTATAPTGGDIYIGIGSNNNYAMPPPNGSRSFTDNAVGYRVEGTFRSIVATTAKTALSTLILDLDIQNLLWPHSTVWTVSIQFVRAECGIGVALPDAGSSVQAAGAARMAARLAPSSESATPSESAESSAAESSESSESESSSSESSENSESSESESSSSASSSESEAAETPALKQGPTTPTDVDVGDQFPVIATDGTDLGTATIQKIESTAPSEGAKATVAVKMSVTTSDTGGDGRLSSIAWDDFAPMVGGVQQASGQATTEGAQLPDQLAPGQTYTGWVAFTAPSAAGKAMWKPAGTAGFTFVLPDPEVPVTSTTTSAPAPVANAPETSEPEAAPTDDAPAAEAPAVEAEDSDPVPTPEKKSRSRSSSDESSADSSADDE
ncbi:MULTISPECIES: hypothetical protein [Gordonia]|uniref:Uncharacterized protein n=2 Tax=Gordonia alkanivorans TaxID=84096 RepID=F9VZD1_9ACTN|nr:MULTISPECIES: hypothetical protein [Gordonia]ETA07989.1 hypothetical protein V525_04695 [Gordonia alkanivorans CGMCC 6845]MDH3006233.1 hypothetical protein [Gordonia alkanivorans]MDH3009558.1 hypothetical protein [Gordonia alkanivorans]MDH3013990.1 hypothetical protein [Gordonia alkanivorans]MDH3018895.1 hypothetical protein [Gordonia alkanivorans]